MGRNLNMYVAARFLSDDQLKNMFKHELDLFLVLSVCDCRGFLCEYFSSFT